MGKGVGVPPFTTGQRMSRAPGGLPAPTLVGSSPAWEQVVGTATRIASKNVRVLITGETGVGKDLLARFIHSGSSRAGKRFVALNCAGLSETLLESELFGHVKGSFTGAYRDKVGCLEQASHGTLFLDEIGEMSLRMQVLLLRFLETGELQPVGSDAPAMHVDVRIISATNRNLLEMIDKGLFREDLFYRINVAHLHVPPLRKRVQDIRPIVEHLIAASDVSLVLSETVMKLLEAYRWPGNVRELRNVVERLAFSVVGRPVEADDLPPGILAQHARYGGPSGEQRNNAADDLYDGLTNGEFRFWEDVYPLFSRRDITRADLRQLIGRGLSVTWGSYRGLLQLFGMQSQDYKRFLNFLAAHDCMLDYREFRSCSSRPETGPVSKGRARELPLVRNRA
jgi:transcriptional regulator with PAS, ATPase and Fis domain